MKAAAWRWTFAGLLALSVAASSWGAVASVRMAAAVEHLQTCVQAFDLALRIRGIE